MSTRYHFENEVTCSMDFVLTEREAQKAIDNSAGSTSKFGQIVFLVEGLHCLLPVALAEIGGGCIMPVDVFLSCPQTSTAMCMVLGGKNTSIITLRMSLLSNWWILLESRDQCTRSQGQNTTRYQICWEWLHGSLTDWIWVAS